MGLTKVDNDNKKNPRGEVNTGDASKNVGNESYDATEKTLALTREQVQELDTRGMLSGDEKPIDTKSLKYVININNGLLVLPDLGENGFALRGRQLINLSKLFKEEEILKSNSLRHALQSGDLRTVELSQIKQEDIKTQKSELDKLEEKHEFTEEGTKISLKVNRHNNPFLARLWEEEKKIVREKQMGRQDLDLHEIPLHAEHAYEKYTD